MKLFSFLKKIFGISQKRMRRSWSDYQQELLVRQGREQFKNLLDKGLGVPIAFL